MFTYVVNAIKIVVTLQNVEVTMGKLNMGILGGFTGTVGTVIGFCNKNGDDVIRVKSKKKRSSNTEGQVNQQTKFGMVLEFMKPLNPLLQIGFCDASGNGMSSFNYACKNALKVAINGEAPDFEFDFSKVVLSKGMVAQPTGTTAELTNSAVNFNWEDNSSTSTGGKLLNAVMVVYNVMNYQLSYSIGMATKADKTGSLPIPNSEVGDKLLFYIFFQSAIDPLQVSTSQFLGSAVVTV
jgi:hypothetical protein